MLVVSPYFGVVLNANSGNQHVLHGHRLTSRPQAGQILSKHIPDTLFGWQLYERIEGCHQSGGVVWNFGPMQNFGADDSANASVKRGKHLTNRRRGSPQLGHKDGRVDQYHKILLDRKSSIAWTSRSMVPATRSSALKSRAGRRAGSSTMIIRTSLPTKGETSGMWMMAESRWACIETVMIQAL